MRTVAITGVVAAAIVAGGWTLQSVGLPQPGRGDVAAVKASQWLLRYRLVASELGHVRARCFHGWFDGPGGRDERGTLLAMSNGVTLRAVASKTLQGTLADLELAGCPDVLGPRIATYVIAHDIHARRTTFAGRPVLALKLRKLTLFVSPRTDRPVGVQLDGLRSTIWLTRLTRAIARALQ